MNQLEKSEELYPGMTSLCLAGGSPCDWGVDLAIDLELYSE